MGGGGWGVALRCGPDGKSKGLLQRCDKSAARAGVSLGKPVKITKVQVHLTGRLSVVAIVRREIKAGGLSVGITGTSVII